VKKKKGELQVSFKLTKEKVRRGEDTRLGCGKNIRIEKGSSARGGGGGGGGGGVDCGRL